MADDFGDLLTSAPPQAGATPSGTEHADFPDILTTAPPSSSSSTPAPSVSAPKKGEEATALNTYAPANWVYGHTAGALGMRAPGQDTGVLDADQAIRDFTFGLSDKAGALGAAVGAPLAGKSFSDQYSDILAKKRTQAQTYEQDHPYAAPVGQVVLGGAGLGMGAVGGPSAITAASPSVAAATMATRPLVSGAAIGVGTGAASGFANSNDSGPSFYGVPLSDITGAGIGAALGAGAGVAIPWIAGKVAPVIRNIVSGSTPDVVTDRATNLISQKIAQDAHAGNQGAADMADAMSALHSAAVPVGMSDVGGENLRGLAGSLYRTPGEASATRSNYLTTRDAGATFRLLDAIDNSVSSGGQSAYRATQDQIAQRSAAAQPLYEALYDRYPTVYTDRIGQFIAEPIMQEGLGAGVKLQRLEALAEGRSFDPSSYTLDFNAAGDPIWKGVPNLRTLDAAKRGLDAILSSDTYRDSNTGRLTQMGRAIDQVRRSFVGELDSLTGGQNGAYAQARAAWGGPSRAMEMLRNGQLWMQRSPEELRDVISNATPTDRQFFTQGVADNMRTSVLSHADSGDESKRILNSPMARQRAAAIFDPGIYDQLATRVLGERQMFQTMNKEIGNSATQQRAMQDTGLHGAGDHGAAPGTLGQLYWPMLAVTAEHHPEIAAGLGAYRGVKGLYNWAMTPSPQTLSRAAQIMSAPLPDQVQTLRGIAGRGVPKISGATPYLSSDVGARLGSVYPGIIGYQGYGP